jgi:hypothetical protein
MLQRDAAGTFSSPGIAHDPAIKRISVVSLIRMREWNLTLTERYGWSSRMKFLAVTCSLFSFSLLSGIASAAIVISGTPSVPPGTFSLTITEDIHFTITESSGPNVFMALQNFGAGLGSSNVYSYDRVDYSLNGGPDTYATYSLFVPNTYTPYGPVLAEDGVLAFPGPMVVAGDTLTIRAGTYSYSGSSGIPASIVGTLEGNVFLFAYGPEYESELTHRVSNVVSLAVPEPHSLLLTAVGGLALLRRRR